MVTLGLGTTLTRWWTQSTTDYTDSYNQASTQSVSSNNQASTSNVKVCSSTKNF